MSRFFSLFRFFPGLLVLRNPAPDHSQTDGTNMDMTMSQGVEPGRDWLALQRELQISHDAQKRQAVLEKLQAKERDDFEAERGRLYLDAENGEKSSLRLQLEDTAREVQDLKEKLSDIQSVKESLEGALFISRLEIRCSQLEKEVTQAKKTVQDKVTLLHAEQESSQKRILELSRRLPDLDEEYQIERSRGERLQFIQKELDTMKGLLEEERSRRLAAEKQGEKLKEEGQAKLGRVKDSLRQLETEASELRETLKTTRRDKENALEALDRQQLQKNEQDFEMEILKQTLTQCQEEKESALKALSDYAFTVEERDKQISELRENIQECTDEKQNALTSVSELRVAVQERDREIKMLKETVLLIQKANKTAASALQEQIQSTKKTEERLSVLTRSLKECESLKESALRAEERFHLLVELLEKQARKDCRDQNEKLEDLSQTLREKEKEIQNCKRENKELQLDKEEESKEKERQSESEKSTLYGKITELFWSRSQKESEVDEAKFHKMSLRDKVEDVSQALLKKEREANLHEQYVNSLMEWVGELKSFIAEKKRVFYQEMRRNEEDKESLQQQLNDRSQAVFEKELVAEDFKRAINTFQHKTETEELKPVLINKENEEHAKEVDREEERRTWT